MNEDITDVNNYYSEEEEEEIDSYDYYESCYIDDYREMMLEEKYKNQ